MKVTTVRFSEDLWRTISREAELAGVSASQFVREAALARAAAASGARGDLAFRTVGETLEELRGLPSGAEEAEIQAALSALSRALSRSYRSDAKALRAQSEQVRHNGEALLRRAAEVRAMRREQRNDQRDEQRDSLLD